MAELVVAGGDPPEVLDAAEHTFDGVAVPVKARGEATLPAPVDLRRDVWGRAHTLDFPAHGVAVISLVAMQDRRTGHPFEQGVGRDAIRNLATGQQEGDGATGEVRQGMDFRGPAAPRTTDGLAALPPFPPAAQRWALTAELSINTCAGGPEAEARAWKTPVHTPLAAQRTKRL